MNKEKAFEIAEKITMYTSVDVRVTSIKSRIDFFKDGTEQPRTTTEMVGYSRDGNYWVEFRTDGDYFNGRYGKTSSERTLTFPNSFNSLTELIGFFNQKFK